MKVFESIIKHISLPSLNDTMVIYNGTFILMCLHSKRWVGSAIGELFTPVFHLKWQEKHKQAHTEVKFESYDFGSLGTPTIDVF